MTALHSQESVKNALGYWYSLIISKFCINVVGASCMAVLPMKSKNVNKVCKGNLGRLEVKWAVLIAREW